MDILLEALLIFVLRVLGIAVSTLSTLMTVQGRKAYAIVAGFVSALVWVIAVGKVVANLNNVWNIISYSAGFSGGTLIGMILEQRMALGFSEVRFLCTGEGRTLADALREAGYGVTEMEGHGREETVQVVGVLIPRKEVANVLKISKRVDEDAIVTVSEPRLVQRGYWHTNAGRQ